MAQAGRVFQPQTVHRIIKEEGAVGIQIEQLPNHHAGADQLLPPSFEGCQRGRAKGEVKGAGRHAQAVVDAAVVIAGHPWHTSPLHEGQGAVAAAIEKDVLHRAPLLHQHPLVDQHGEAQLFLVEGTGGGDVVGAETEMVQAHGEAK